ncbi:kinase-like domain-containing protein [Mycena filopes]|nr:kinase-like domain-containing protein [Mycena filopes]
MLMARNPTFAERSLEIVNAALAFEVILDSNDRGTLTAFWQHTFDQYIVPQSQQTESLPPPLDGCTPSSVAVISGANTARKSLAVAYEIGRPLGTGSYAEVYRAIVATTPPAVIAVKRVTSKGEDAEEVYNRECRILKEVGKHPNVVQYLGATKWNPNTLFNDIFLEYAGGATIEKILACNGRFPESWCKGVMRQVLKGLCHLHSLEIVHRDIKGDNIIITAFGVVKLSDLGISKFVEDIPALGAPSTDTGTDGYVAPEILQRNGGYTPLADIWSTGCLLLEMFHGKWPSAEYTNHVWEGENDGQVKDVNKIISPRAAVSEQVRSLLTRHILVGAEYRLSAEKLLSVVWLQ